MAKSRTLTATALFAALITVGTLYLKVPGPTGYYHMGDGLVYTAAIVLGLWPAAFAASVGSALADVLGGAAVFAPWTFVIKGLTAVVVAFAARGGRNVLAMLLGALVTVVGYAAATAILYGPPAAVAETLGNLLQVGVGVILALVLLPIARRSFQSRR